MQLPELCRFGPASELPFVEAFLALHARHTICLSMVSAGSHDTNIMRYWREENH